MLMEISEGYVNALGDLDTVCESCGSFQYSQGLGEISRYVSKHLGAL